MSEELIQRGLDQHGIPVGSYEYYDTCRTNLNAFKRFKVIPPKTYGKYGKREPDGLLVDRSDKRNIRVIVLFEYKSPQKFRSRRQKKEAIEQCNDLCQEVGACCGVVSDKQTYIWFNPNQPNKDNEYKDRTTGKKRSYSLITNEDKKFLSEPFSLQKKSRAYDINQATENTLYYIERILSCVSAKNSHLITTEEVDPLNLARAVWQDIYINTAKSPTKCLYNVVELFIFKFLSDLDILSHPNDFDFVYTLSQTNSAKDALSYYAANCRQKIRQFFPAGKDRTTIINGTIFVDSDGKPVESQANLFKNTLKKYNEFSSLRNVKKEFKTKLFETFLKESSEKIRLGQFFTPRKVVKAIVDMASVENLCEGARVCDPFCGVGGFIVEIFQEPVRKKDFLPKENGVIKPGITYHGFDKGTDEDDERIIILAKANMLIYLSDIIAKHPQYTKKFAKVFNETFHFLTESNLGTLKNIILDEKEKYDLILTNPPYITGGVASIKDEIRSEGLEHHYCVQSKGVDGLALQWILRSLKRGGNAFVVVSDGIFNADSNRGLREHIRKTCFLNGIISLPIKTFFNTPQKTYILILSKKHDQQVEQTFPVFTYLVSDIGETLDVNRFETEGISDLQRAVNLFNLFKGAPQSFPLAEIDDPRCKLQPITRFATDSYWHVDKWWTREERIKLGLEKPGNAIGLAPYRSKIKQLIRELRKHENQLAQLSALSSSVVKTEKCKLSKIFDPVKGDPKYTKKYMREHPGEFPVYSSSTSDSGSIGHIDTFDYDTVCLTWTTDGIHAGTLFYREGKFSMTTHCGALIMKKHYKKSIHLPYLYYCLRQKLKDYAISEGNKRLTVRRIKDVLVELPVDMNGNYDYKKQKELACKYSRIDALDMATKERIGVIIDLEPKYQ